MEDTESAQRSMEAAALESLESSRQIAAHQRAPTLMAAEAAGSGGSVQVWSPDEAELRKRSRRATAGMALYFGSPLAFYPIMQLVIQGALTETAFLLMFSVFMVLMGAAGLNWVAHMGAPAAKRRPRYLTTDDTGIGVTTQRGSRYLRWDEIISALRAPWTSEMVIWTTNRERIRLNLTGYAVEEQTSLWERITGNAELQPCRSWNVLSPRDWWVRPGYTVSFTTGRIVPTSVPLKPGSRPALPGERMR